MDFRFNIFVLLLFLLIDCRSSDCQDMYDNDHTRKYCGGHLAQALSAICKGNYNPVRRNGQVFRKRAYWDSQYSADMPSSDVLSYPFQKRSAANAVVQRRRRSNPGVYTECCEKPCSPAELSSYCAAAPYRRRRRR